MIMKLFLINIIIVFMKIFKLIASVFIFAGALLAFYLVLAFIAWDIEWVSGELWFLRVLFSTICLPISIVIATEFYKNYPKSLEK